MIQGASSSDVKRYAGRVPSGQVQEAIYWNVYGENADASKAVGEGFVFGHQKGLYEWNSSVFNKDKDIYHDGVKEISPLVKKCVESIFADWRRRQYGAVVGKTYTVEKLLQHVGDKSLHTYKF